MVRNEELPDVIVGIDVETCNPQGAICEFAAIAIDIETGASVFTVTSLIDPGNADWHPITTGIHGIRRAHVAGKPKLAVVWHQFRDELERIDRVRVFAHNASADSRWLSNGLGRPLDLEVECTIALAKRTTALTSYRLPDVCRALGIPFNETHRAVADARATATIARQLLMGGGGMPMQVTPQPAGRTEARRWTSNEARGRNHEIIAATAKVGTSLSGIRACITGQFSCGWSRKEAKANIVAHGGTPLDGVSGGCNLLIIAGVATLTEADFTTEKARQARTRGIRVISEAQLLGMIAADSNLGQSPRPAQ